MRSPTSSSSVAVHSSPRAHHHSLIALTVGALGVVFGDIGTSPLYAINEIFFGHAMNHYSRLDVEGAISLVFWAMTLVIAIKYVCIVMRADNDGEGGVFALYSNIKKLPKPPAWILGLLLFGSGLLYGDGIITPAISVVSAVEGIKVIAPSFAPYVVPCTLTILTLLFSIQRFGTHVVGKLFGPIMILWFVTIGVLGTTAVVHNPVILEAIHPYYAWNFLTTHSFHTILLALGSVMLVITGGEAMFADMGHFGKTPIRLAWYLLAYPALLLNYFGQGAYLLSDAPIKGNNLFFSLVPPAYLPAVVLLATLATIIASQAMISGAFSLTKQAISLRLIPYLPTIYTHKDHEGQIYIPFVNWALFAGAFALVLRFQSSTNLAGAYGFAVAGDMFITTLSMIIVAIGVWKWPRIYALALFLPFLVIDAGFLGANTLKLFVGGYIPFSVGFLLYSLITIWTWGRAHVIKAFRNFDTMTVKELVDLQEQSSHDLDRTVVYLTRNPILSLSDTVPIQTQKFWTRNGILPKHLAFLNVELLKEPHAKERFVVKHLNTKGLGNGSITSITVYFGFMENPDIEPLIKKFIAHHDIPSTHPQENWSFKIIYERPLLRDGARFLEQLKFAVYSHISNVTPSADEYFGLGKDHQLTIDVVPVRMR